MKQNLYKYPAGSILSISTGKTPAGMPIAHLVLYDFLDEKVPPTRIEAFGGMAEYLDQLECTDDEERYLDCDFYYDVNFALVAVVMPSTDSARPSKVLASSMMGTAFDIFGPVEHLDTDLPAPMGAKSLERWLTFANDTLGKMYDVREMFHSELPDPEARRTAEALDLMEGVEKRNAGRIARWQEGKEV